MLRKDWKCLIYIYLQKLTRINACMFVNQKRLLSHHFAALAQLGDLEWQPTQLLQPFYRQNSTGPLKENPMEKCLLSSPLTGSGCSDIESVLSNSVVSVWIKTGGPVTSSCSWPHSQMSAHSCKDLLFDCQPDSLVSSQLCYTLFSF